VKKEDKLLPPFAEAIKQLSKRRQSSSFVEYDYDYDGWCGCNDDYCHHHKINNAKVGEVNVDYIVEELSKGCSILDTYCIDRVLRGSKLPDTSSWEVSIVKGYYGEEVDGVELDGAVRKDIVDQLTELSGITDNADKVKKVLEFEYGYLLPKLQLLTTAKIVKVPLDSVQLFNQDYLRKVSKETVDYYQSYKLPRGVCVKEGDHYSLVDGYHRMFSALKYKLATITIIELS
jgi:hypothetical protein